MKSKFALLLALVVCLSMFAACGSTATDDGAKTVGIIQLVEHTSLDEIYTAIETELLAQAQENNIALTIEYENAQGDMATINTICQQFVANDVDLIIAIATSAAQGAAAAVDGTDIPVIFSAVTDPVAAELVDALDAPGGNVTGTSDAISAEKIFELALELTPEVESFGLIYNTSEVNSVSVIEEAKTYLDSIGVTYVEGAVTSSADVQIAAQNLLSQCDAIFSPTDNTVASAMAVLAQEAIDAGKPVYVGADSMVTDGALATVGVNYTNLGTQTGAMAMKVLLGTSPADLPVEVLADNAVVVNAETAQAIGIDVSAYTE